MWPIESSHNRWGNPWVGWGLSDTGSSTGAKQQKQDWGRQWGSMGCQWKEDLTYHWKQGWEHQWERHWEWPAEDGKANSITVLWDYLQTKQLYVWLGLSLSIYRPEITLCFNAHRSLKCSFLKNVSILSPSGRRSSPHSSPARHQS